MPQFTSVEQIYQHLQKSVPEILKKVGEEVREKLYLQLQNQFYNKRPETENYKRTYMLLNSLTVSAVKNIGTNTWEVRVFYDTDKIEPVETGAPFPAHMSILDGEDSSDLLPWWVEKGQKSKIHSWGEYNIVENTKKEIIEEKLLLNEFRRELKSKGFRVK